MRKVLWYVGVALIVGFLAPVGQVDLFAQNDPKMEVNQGDFVRSFMRANISYKKGEDLFKKGDYTNAELELTKCLEIAPLHAEASFILAQIHYKGGKVEQSYADITQAESNFIKYSEFKTFSKQDHLSNARDAGTQIDEKIRALEARLPSASPGERSNLEAQIGALQRDRIALVDRPDRPDMDAPVLVPARFHFVHGNILLKMKKPAQAVAQYEQAIQSDPKYVNAYNNLASIYFGSGNHQKAFDIITQAEAKGLQVNAELKKAILAGLGR